MNTNIGNKIIVVGCPGSGKSTFSMKLQEYTKLPLIHLDNIWWNSDRTHISRDEFDQQLASLMDTDRWIIDGDYSRTYETRISNCDTIIFLDYSEVVCMNGIKERVGKKRADIPWTEHELDSEIIERVHNYQNKNRLILLELLEKYCNKQKLIFKSRIQSNEWLDSFYIRVCEGYKYCLAQTVPYGKIRKI